MCHGPRVWDRWGSDPVPATAERPYPALGASASRDGHSPPHRPPRRGQGCSGRPSAPSCPTCHRGPGEGVARAPSSHLLPAQPLLPSSSVSTEGRGSSLPHPPLSVGLPGDLLPTASSRGHPLALGKEHYGQQQGGWGTTASCACTVLGHSHSLLAELPPNAHLPRSSSGPVSVGDVSLAHCGRSTRRGSHPPGHAGPIRAAFPQALAHTGPPSLATEGLPPPTRLHGADTLKGSYEPTDTCTLLFTGAHGCPRAVLHPCLAHLCSRPHR